MAMKSNITFYKRFVGDILSGKKSITIRNELDKNYLPSSLVQASYHPIISSIDRKHPKHISFSSRQQLLTQGL